ncbi:MAG: cytochrome C [Alphaproteobacteria bacterium]|nr:cytochrome C [Alphaproteobacteria bacterium]
MVKNALITATSLAAITIGSVAVAADKVAYPWGYRSWVHVKSMIINADHPLANPFAGMHHVYANPKAVKGLKSGKYEDGSILIFDLLESNAGGGAVQEGKRKFIGVMHKDAKAFAATGGWGYEAFAGDTKSKRVVTDGGTGCYGCHSGQKDKDFVFSAYRN